MLFHFVQHRIDVIKGEDLLPSQAFEEREEPSTNAWRLATKIQTKLINGKYIRWNKQYTCLITKVLANIKRNSCKQSAPFLALLVEYFTRPHLSIMIVNFLTPLLGSWTTSAQFFFIFLLRLRFIFHGFEFTLHCTNNRTLQMDQVLYEFWMVYLRIRPQVSMVYGVISHAGCL